MTLLCGQASTDIHQSTHLMVVAVITVVIMATRSITMATRSIIMDTKRNLGMMMAGVIHLIIGMVVEVAIATGTRNTTVAHMGIRRGAVIIVELVVVFVAITRVIIGEVK